MYTAAVNDHLANARNVGKPAGSTHSGVVGTPGDGPFLAIHLVIGNVQILAAGYNTWGCPAAIACGSVLAEMVRGMPVSAAELLTPEDLIQALGGLPEGKEGRAGMAVEALQRALSEVK